jgi:hypothetical protein
VGDRVIVEKKGVIAYEGKKLSTGFYGVNLKVMKGSVSKIGRVSADRWRCRMQELFEKFVREKDKKGSKVVVGNKQSGAVVSDCIKEVDLQGGCVSSINEEVQSGDVVKDVAVSKTYASCVRKGFQVDSTKVHRCFGGVRVRKVEDGVRFRGDSWRNRRYSWNFRGRDIRYSSGRYGVNENFEQTGERCGSSVLGSAEVEEVPFGTGTKCIKSGNIAERVVEVHAEDVDARGLNEMHAEKVVTGDLGVVHVNDKNEHGKSGIEISVGDESADDSYYDELDYD